MVHLLYLDCKVASNSNLLSEHCQSKHKEGIKYLSDNGVNNSSELFKVSCMLQKFEPSSCHECKAAVIENGRKFHFLVVLL